MSTMTKTMIHSIGLSGYRESNPNCSVGNAVCYRYNIPAVLAPILASQSLRSGPSGGELQRALRPAELLRRTPPVAIGASDIALSDLLRNTRPLPRTNYA